ncbi:MAG: DnaJ domain-containing protein [Candidatus Kuenenia sp.]|nr:DnaJ domain-containing protein [Candidatus Kuenenia hertensis]
MVNYYTILEVHEEVSAEEIKRSFRNLIKKYHPDTNGPNKLWAESKTKIIIQAYKILSDSHSRKQYDMLYRHSRNKQETVRETKQKTPTTASEKITIEIRVIFSDLLDGHANKAIRKYEHLLNTSPNIDFFLHLNHRDFIDCKFLLAEAYEKSGKYETSIKLYEYILEKGKQNTYRQHLLEEIKDRIRNIYCRKLTKKTSPDKALLHYQKLLQLDLCKNENAFIYKKMAECYLKLQDYENALKHLHIALSLKPKLQGLNKLKIKLNQYLQNNTIL